MRLTRVAVAERHSEKDSNPKTEKEGDFNGQVATTIVRKSASVVGLTDSLVMRRQSIEVHAPEAPFADRPVGQ